MAGGKAIGEVVAVGWWIFKLVYSGDVTVVSCPCPIKWVCGQLTWERQ